MLELEVVKKLNRFKLHMALSMEKADILVVLGPSGCGKTSFLNLIAGVMEPDRGQITYKGEVFYSSENNINLPIYKRNIGYLQQKSNLFPHMNVLENIKYGFKAEGANISELIEVLEIEDILYKKPREISGGQQQRAALARALAVNPRLLLMDEPFSALDNLIMPKLREMLIRINKEFKIPVIFVTHDIEEAYILGDKIAVIDKGELLQVDYKDKVYSCPANIKVASFLGMRNIFSGNLESKDGKDIFRIGGTLINLPEGITKSIISKDAKLTLAIRPESIDFVEKSNREHRDIFSGRIVEIHRGINTSKLKLNIDSDLTLEMCMDNYMLGKHGIKLEDSIPIEFRTNAMAILNN